MTSYLAFKALHLIAVISWLAGLLYLPRIFVYHSETKNNLEQDETFKVMEKRLFLYIMNPAMVASWIFGILLINDIGHGSFKELWLQIKMISVLILTIYHFFLFSCLKNFQASANSYSSKFYRIINEIPTILLIIIIFSVVFKPL